MTIRRLYLYAALILLAVAALSTSARAEERPVVNVNTADAAQLMLLPGIGEVTAHRIIETRSAAPYASVDDLLQVKGIGPAKLARIRPHVVLTGDTTATAEIK